MACKTVGILGLGGIGKVLLSLENHAPVDSHEKLFFFLLVKEIGLSQQLPLFCFQLFPFLIGHCQASHGFRNGRELL